MDQNKTAIERAFELAALPAPNSFGDIKRRLASEGYSVNQLDGPSLRRQLRGLIDAAKVAEPAGGDGSA